MYQSASLLLKMVVVFKLLILTVYLSITCNGNIASETSGFECRIPDNSSIDYPINVHVNLSEEEFDLLQIEGRCFLFCATEKYSNEVNNINFISILLTYQYLFSHIVI